MNGMETPGQLRGRIARAEWAKPTTGLASAYAQANLVILHRKYAFDFLLFCFRNPKPCPILEVLEPGVTEPHKTAPGADIRTHLPLYRIWRNGQLEKETTDIVAHFNEDMVSFLLGCSFTFEAALLEAGVPVRNIEEGKNVSMYITNRKCAPAGPFSAPLVVTMRPIPNDLIMQAIRITSRYTLAHGAPIQVGEPGSLGIGDLDHPDFGDPVAIREGETPVFWACGVTSSLAVLSARPEICITHVPGHMFITDILNETLAVV
jgi:uncharacterized protein YcsI (UPF0317 family)